ncbi:MAG: chondroitinase-B domain-containing protein [bacterium]
MSSQRGTPPYNYFEECNGEIETVSNKSCGNVYRNNTFVSCQGTLTLRHGNRCTVEGNFFFGNKVPNSGGIRIIGEDHKVYNNYITGTVGNSLKSALTLMNGVPNSPLDRYYQVKRAIVVFNTLVDNKYPINLGGGRSSELSLQPLDCVIANNVVYSSTNPLITLTDTPINLTWEGNIFNGATLGISPQPAGISMVDPKIVKGSDGLWRPQLSSPVINAAKGSYPFVLNDMDGQARVDSLDIGADELSNASMTRRPLTPKDVGPPPQVWTSVEQNTTSNPDQFKSRIEAAYPNPFNGMTRIRVWLPKSGRAVLNVYNLLGEKVQTLFDNVVFSTGSYEFLFGAEALPSGIYFARLSCGSTLQTQKLLYQK